MYAIRHHTYGPPEVLKLEELPLPDVRAGEVHVAIRTAAINHFDLLSRAGIKRIASSLPRIVGIDAAGVVVRNESSRRDLQPGTPVVILGTRMGNGGPGAYATDAVLPEEEVFPIPPGMDERQVLSYGMAALTAYHAVNHRLAVPRGSRVLVQGASGGVAGWALQLAQVAGHSVCATTSQAQKVPGLQSAGARQVWLYTEPDWTRRALDEHGPFDAVINAAGGPSVQEGLRVLRHGGEMLTIGTTRHDVAVQIDLFEFLCAEWVLKGVHVTPYSGRERLRMLGELHALEREGRIRPRVHGVLPLHRAAEAHRLMEAGEHTGRVLLDCTQTV